MLVWGTRGSPVRARPSRHYRIINSSIDFGFYSVLNKDMTSIQVYCSRCKKKFLRRTGWINENKKLGRKHYCSFKCMGNSRKLRETLICENPGCKKKFERRVRELSAHSYCSRSCAVTVKNAKYPKNPGVIKRCKYCKEEFVSREKYCSRWCADKGKIISKREILKLIGKFNKTNKRIPFK